MTSLESFLPAWRAADTRFKLHSKDLCINDMAPDTSNQKYPYKKHARQETPSGQTVLCCFRQGSNAVVLSHL